MATKKVKKQKAKLSECCGARMLGGVQCENCGSNGKFTSYTAIIRKLEAILNAGLVKPIEKIAVKASEQAPGERFVDNGDGTISDTQKITLPSGKKVRLMWQKEGSANRMEHKDTEEYCKNSEVGGYKDWRMPTVEELESIIDRTKRNPAINPLFKCESASYWSSSIYANGTAVAWYVNFSVGNVSYNGRYGAYYVRPVRQY
jgi:hypothetical protein